MKKGILMSFLVAISLFFGMPVMADVPTMNAYEQQMVDDVKVSVSIQNSTIVVNGAAGYEMEIISLTGRRVVKMKIESNSQRYNSEEILLAEARKVFQNTVLATENAQFNIF